MVLQKSEQNKDNWKKFLNAASVRAADFSWEKKIFFSDRVQPISV